MSKLIVNENPKSPVSEAYRTIRTNIQFTSVDDTIKIITVTSAMASEGKTTTVANLATAFAQTGKSVVLVDADLRKPSVHKMFDLPNLRGLVNAIIHDKDLSELLLDSKVENLKILPAGTIPPNPSELLGSKSMKDLIKHLSEQFDYVLIDAPPVALVTDAAIIANMCDGVILVGVAGKTEIKSVQYAKKLLGNANAHILGMVLNKIPVDKNNHYKYQYYSYYQQYGEETKQGFFSKLFGRKKR